MHDAAGLADPERVANRAIHEQASMLMGELPQIAWRAFEPPTWTTRASEADITHTMLRDGRSQTEIRAALRGARDMLGTDPFAMKVLVNPDVFRKCADAGYKRLSAEAIAQTKNLLARLLRDLAIAA